MKDQPTTAKDQPTVRLLALITELRKRGVASVEIEGGIVCGEIGVGSISLVLLPQPVEAPTMEATQRILAELANNPEVDAQSVSDEIQKQRDQDFYGSAG